MKHHGSRVLTTTTLAMGGATQYHMLGEFLHSILMDTGLDAASVSKYRDSVRAITSDRGVERLLVDAPNIISIDRDALRPRLDTLPASECDLAKYSGSYLFPNAVGFPDMLHTLFGVLERVLVHAPGWASYESDLRSVVNFLCQHDLRERFVQTCLGDQPLFVRGLFRHWSHRHLDWRWEFLEVVLVSLTPLWPYLRFFDAKKILGAWGGSDSMALCPPPPDLIIMQPARGAGPCGGEAPRHPLPPPPRGPVWCGAQRAASYFAGISAQSVGGMASRLNWLPWSSSGTHAWFCFASIGMMRSRACAGERDHQPPRARLRRCAPKALRAGAVRNCPHHLLLGRGLSQVVRRVRLS